MRRCEGLTKIKHLTSYSARRATLTALALALAALSRAAADELCGPVVTPLPETTSEAGDPDDQNVVVSSDAAELGRDGDARLKGKVDIRQGSRQLSAEDVTYDAESRSFQVDGHVEYRDPQIRVKGETGSYDAVGGAKFGDAEFEVPSRPARGSAKELAVTPLGKVRLDEVRYTTCPVGNSDWMLSADDIDLDTATRNGTGRGVRLDFKGVPILYTPIISFPLGDQRKSGFLFPDFSYSQRSGLELAAPYYFNLAPSYDLLATPRYFSDRGLQLEGEFRYLGQESEGKVNGRYLPDDDLRDIDRSLFHWQHKGDFARHWRVEVDAANASDGNYFEDFGLGAEGTSVTYLERNAQVRYFGEHWSFLGQAQNFQTIDLSIPDETRPYSRAPRLLAHGLWADGPLGLEYGLDGEAVNFHRDDGLTGVRVDVAPALRLPFRRPGLYVEPAAAYRFTRYNLSDTEPGQETSPDRGAPVLSLDAGLALERPVGDNAKRILTLEPRLLYLYVPFRDQTDLPIFDTGLPDLNLVQLFRLNRYVGADRLSDANQVSGGITARLLETGSGRQFLSATLGNTYYFETPRVALPDEVVEDRSGSNIVGELALDAYKDWSVKFGYEYDPENTQGNRSEVGVQYRPAPDRVANVGYRFRRDLVEQVDASLAWPVADRWNVFVGGIYSLRDESSIDQFAGLEYSSCCWRLRVVQRRYVSSRTGERESSIAVQLELKGLSSVGVPADAFLEDAIRGYSRELEPGRASGPSDPR